MLVNKTTIDEEELDSIIENVQNEETHITPIAKKSNHYINNPELYQEFVRYHEAKQKAIAEGRPIPPLTEKIGIAILQVSKKVCNHRWFSKYTLSWKEAMIGNAIEKCVMYCDFDPSKSTNPFAYLSSICFNAISQQLKAERKQLYIKYKSKLNCENFYGELDDNVKEEDIVLSYDHAIDEHMREFVHKFEESHFAKQRKKKFIGKDEIIDIDDV